MDLNSIRERISKEISNETSFSNVTKTAFKALLLQVFCELMNEEVDAFAKKSKEFDERMVDELSKMELIIKTLKKHKQQ